MEPPSATSDGVNEIARTLSRLTGLDQRRDAPLAPPAGPRARRRDQGVEYSQAYGGLEPRSVPRRFAEEPPVVGATEEKSVSHRGERPPRSSGSNRQPTQAAPGSASSSGSSYSTSPKPYIYKPLPPLPPNPPPQHTPKRSASQASVAKSSRSAESLSLPSAPTLGSGTTPSHRADSAVGNADWEPRRPNLETQPSQSSIKSSASNLELVSRRLLVSDDKRRSNSVYYLDISPRSTTLASKHGRDVIKVWNVDDGALQSVIKFSSYTEARSRSRDYLIRSHAILSEALRVIAVATRFGRTIEVWNWLSKSCLQTIDNTDRWTGTKMEQSGGGCSLAAYRAATDEIDLYTATWKMKPLAKTGSIKLAQAGLPFVPQYPELALSETSPLLVVAAGPRPTIVGHAPTDKETLLVAWETRHDGAVLTKPFRVARPWQHEQIKTAIPCQLCTYGSVAVSIWIPASFQAVPVPSSRSGAGYHLAPVEVLYRYVLVWDFSANSTRTFAIPNCTSCISPDCRYVAYCQARGAEFGARGCLTILDVVDGREVWTWPDKDALAINSGPKRGFEQFDGLGRVTELAFSADGEFLIVGDLDGRMGVYNIRD